MGTWLVILAAISLLAVYIYIQFVPPDALHEIRKISSFRALSVVIKRIPFNQVAANDAAFVLGGDKLLRFAHRGTWGLMVGNVETAKQILNDTDTFPKLIAAHHSPQSAYAQYMGVNIVESNHATWKRHRSIVSPAFRKQFDPELFIKLALKLTRLINEKDGHEIDIFPHIQSLTVDALGTALLDVEFNSLEGQQSDFLSAYDAFTSEFIKPLYYIFPLFDHPMNPFRRPLFGHLAKIDQHLSKLVNERKLELSQDKSQDRQDLLTLMLKESENGSKFSDKEIQDNIRIFFLAGHDTTSSSLSIVLYLLARYPEVQIKAREEAIRVLGSDPKAIPTNDSVKSLDYITAVIKETLRLYPSVSILPERVAATDTVIQGHVIPKGTIFLMHVYLLHRDPETWSEPDDFRPDRFLNPDTKTSNWLPFGGGSRLCLGMGFSMLEQRLILATILRTYHISLPPFSSLHQGLDLGPSSMLKPKNLLLNFAPL